MYCMWRYHDRACSVWDTEKKQGVCAFILDKSGELVDDDVIVTANTYYGAYYDAAKDSKYTDYLQLLKDHHFIQ